MVFPIPMRPVGWSRAVAAKVFVAVVGESLPRSIDGVAASIIVGDGDWAGCFCIEEDGITGRLDWTPLWLLLCIIEQGGQRATRRCEGRPRRRQTKKTKSMTTPFYLKKISLLRTEQKQ